ncbi:pyridoxal phosphate-dependent aminotransferase, partial [Candidatus Entotheonella palauensis]
NPAISLGLGPQSDFCNSFLNQSCSQGVSMPIQPRPEVQQIIDVVHGALDFSELEAHGLTPETVIDFSVNNNPYGPSPRVREVLHTVAIDRYPDREALALRRCLAQHLGVSIDQLIVANGSMELLWFVALAYLRPGDPVLILEPTFGEYERVVQFMGAQHHTYTTRPENGFAVDEAALLETLQRLEPRLMFICNPNNPTGVHLPIEAIADWAARHPDTLFVIDEAYLPFVSGPAPSLIGHVGPNLLVLHSLTKAHALAGIRLGYAVGTAEVITALGKVRPTWNVNAIAQAAGIVAINDVSHLTQTLAQVAADKATLVANLEAIGLAPLPSVTHFFLCEVGPAHTLRQSLLQQGILVRDCASFGLPHYIRIASRRPSENDQLICALSQAYTARR